jgi:3-hydroxyisobutyrate dehydrogenase
MTFPKERDTMVTLADPGTTRIGWIGTGVMGNSMLGHLLAKGYRASVFTRTREKAAELIERGAEWADSPRAVAERSDVTFAIVGFPADVREVFLDPTRGALAGAKGGSILVDCTTSEPTLAVELAEAAAAKGVRALDAPVSGGDIGARNAALSFMVGGEPSAFDACLPLFETMGKTIKLQGAPGAGQHTKLVNQILIAGNMVGVCEAMLYAKRSGLDPLKVIESVGGGAAGSWSVNNLGPRIVKGDFEPGFFVEHFLKDMRIALEESRRMGLTVPGLALVEQLYRSVQAIGLGRKGTQALYLALEKMSGG